MNVTFQELRQVVVNAKERLRAWWHRIFIQRLWAGRILWISIFISTVTMVGSNTPMMVKVVAMYAYYGSIASLFVLAGFSPDFKTRTVSFRRRK